jgi:N-acetylmuramoyl-L-alanine amidase
MKRKVDLIVLHCSASKENVNYTFEQCKKDHRARGFSMCGYHFFISRDGTINIGRSLEMPGAHVQGYNTKSIGICYEGGLDINGKAKDTRTDAQKAAIIKCIREAIHYSENKIKRICGHRDLSKDLNGNGVVEPHEWVKVCPSFEASTEYSYLLKEQELKKEQC